MRVIQAPTALTRSLIQTLADALPVHVTTLRDLPPAARKAVIEGEPQGGGVFTADAPGGSYLACRYHDGRNAVIVAGPFRRPDDIDDDTPRLTPPDEARARAALSSAAATLRYAEIERLDRLELASQVEVTSRSVLAVTGELELDVVLRRIVDLAREIAGARYAALGVPAEGGRLVTFVTSGMTDEQEARISHRPLGLGLLGLLLTEPRTIRLRDLRDHPASVGFPTNHPPMSSFLGVPIISRGRNLGNLYLTEKRFGSEFTENDARLVELLARHAAVAIDNARLYHEIDTQQRELQLIIDQLPEAVLLVEPDPERVTIANQHTFEINGWVAELPMSIEEFFGRNPRYSVDGARVPIGDLAVVRSLREGVSFYRREVQISRPDGSQITVLINSSPLFDADGRVSAAIAVFQDITQIKDAEQLKDDFLSLVSHELRTPLTAIQGGSLLLQTDWQALDDETRGALLSDIANESRRLGTLIENMVNISSIRAGRMVMETEPVHLRRLIDRAVAAERENAPSRTFRVETEPNLFASADAGRIDQLVRNLVHNAVKYSPPGAPIEISGARDGGMIVVGVRDHGPGIDEEDLPFVFDRFHRSRRVVTGGTPGLGLGLYLARHLVEAHGGRIWIERPEDGGTRVRFTLPDALADEVPDGESEAEWPDEE